MARAMQPRSHMSPAAAATASGSLITPLRPHAKDRRFRAADPWHPICDRIRPARPQGFALEVMSCHAGFAGSHRRPPQRRSAVGCRPCPPVRSPEASKAVPAGLRPLSNYCAVCHGTDAKGTGPLAESLKRRPADLTVMARNNKGTYDRDLVRRIIDGTEPGQRPRRRRHARLGRRVRALGGRGPRAAVRPGWMSLVEYLATAQAK